MPDLRALPPETLRAIAERHGLPASSFSRLPSTGIVNAIYLLGEDHVLRVPEDEPEGLADTLTESVAVPAARAAGVMTSALVAFDESRELLPVPYTIYEWVRGETLGLLGLEPAGAAGAYRELGRELARLHSGVSECPDPLGRLDDTERLDPRPGLEALAATGGVSAQNARWLARSFERLEHAALTPVEPRFLHNDLHPLNVMVRVGADGLTLAAMLDWGDAAWGDPALEFAQMPLRAVPFALAGYREVMPLEADGTVEARVLWDHLAEALEYLTNRPDPTQAHWGAPPAGRLLEVLAFALSGPGGGWDHLLAGA